MIGFYSLNNLNSLGCCSRPQLTSICKKKKKPKNLPRAEELTGLCHLSQKYLYHLSPTLRSAQSSLLGANITNLKINLFNYPVTKSWILMAKKTNVFITSFKYSAPSSALFGYFWLLFYFCNGVVKSNSATTIIIPPAPTLSTLVTPKMNVFFCICNSPILLSWFCFNIFKTKIVSNVWGCDVLFIIV